MYFDEDPNDRHFSSMRTVTCPHCGERQNLYDDAFMESGDRCECCGASLLD